MGIYPDVSLKLASQRRDEARKLVARDIDPSAYKRSWCQWARNSSEAVANEWIAKHSTDWSTGWVRRLERELGAGRSSPTSGRVRSPNSRRQTCWPWSAASRHAAT